jgi:hypothetical protein
MASVNFQTSGCSIRDPRFAPDHDPIVETDDAVGFLPIEIEGTAGSSEMPSRPISGSVMNSVYLARPMRVSVTVTR